MPVIGYGKEGRIKEKLLVYIYLSSVFSGTLYQVLDMSSYGIRNRMLPIPLAARSKEGLANFNPQEGLIIFKDSTEGHACLHIYRKGWVIEPIQSCHLQTISYAKSTVE